ncbi:MAG TPA: hypothetical protein PK052_05305 [Anaerohalosphaeraceae bacterium]|nr:hypothetical protein [Anaerohalosphaeraceae bacterium]HOL31381.1 hypothetical protein [Anaerohalosphaeraceae bacterium]HOM76321.1 hypothetical protein [Anaerohalosphaeraceae bacterium]HPC64038.1 hypothetical protein [Anaerohalosphaeraceae bacterium]HPO70280.1 hypothetical protein [Anaerohalosphaeraceae bacterium]
MDHMGAICLQITADSGQKKESTKGIMALSAAVLLLAGCGLRYAATEQQKENAWLHWRVCRQAAETAAEENSSSPLCGLTALAEAQSEAFVLDYGLPAWRPEEDNSAALLDEAKAAAAQAQADAAKRPDVWAAADGLLELAIGLAGLVGGVYGARAAGFLKTARAKSQALQEIIAGNELFKRLYPDQAGRFKEAQAHQSASTRQIVASEKH